jgi:hypothetical protein
MSEARRDFDRFFLDLKQDTQMRTDIADGPPEVEAIATYISLKGYRIAPEQIAENLSDILWLARVGTIQR